MSLNDLLAEHASTVFLNREHFGEEVLYRDPTVPEKTITAVLGDVQTTEIEDGDGRRYLRRLMSCTIARDPAAASGGVAAPREDAVITARGLEWAVEAIEGMDAHLCICRLTRKERLAAQSTRIGK